MFLEQRWRAGAAGTAGWAASTRLEPLANGVSHFNCNSQTSRALLCAVTCAVLSALTVSCCWVWEPRSGPAVSQARRIHFGGDGNDIISLNTRCGATCGKILHVVTTRARIEIHTCK